MSGAAASASGGWTVLLVWLAVINLLTFIVYGADKRRARKGKWRVPEKTLFLLPLLGGSVGALLGMKVFRHKVVQHLVHALLFGVVHQRINGILRALLLVCPKLLSAKAVEESVGDDKGGTPCHQLIHAILDNALRAGVDGTGGLVQN